MTTYLDNRKAHFNYEIKDTIEAGIELLGFEVKAIKSGKGNLSGAFCAVRGGEVFIIGFDLPPYQPQNTPQNYESNRIRRLLLSKKEIKKITEADKERGLTLIPLSLYSKNRLIKVSIAIARGKKSYNKKETIKKRDLDREMEREYKAR